jgi:hypothetical protein
MFGASIGNCDSGLVTNVESQMAFGSSNYCDLGPLQFGNFAVASNTNPGVISILENPFSQDTGSIVYLAFEFDPQGPGFYSFVYSVWAPEDVFLLALDAAIGTSGGPGSVLSEKGCSVVPVPVPCSDEDLIASFSVDSNWG